MMSEDLHSSTADMTQSYRKSCIPALLPGRACNSSLFTGNISQVTTEIVTVFGKCEGFAL